MADTVPPGVDIYAQADQIILAAGGYESSADIMLRQPGPPDEGWRIDIKRLPPIVASGDATYSLIEHRYQGNERSISVELTSRAYAVLVAVRMGYTELVLVDGELPPEA